MKGVVGIAMDIRKRINDNDVWKKPFMLGGFIKKDIICFVLLFSLGKKKNKENKFITIVHMFQKRES